jgi:hypothetical protein
MPLFGEKPDFVLKIADFSGVDVTTLVGKEGTEPISKERFSF